MRPGAVHVGRWVPWAVPWAVGVALGAAAGELGWAAGTASVPVAAALTGAVVAAVAVTRARPAARRRWVALAIFWFGIGSTMGAARAASALAAPDPWATEIGTSIAFAARVVDGVAWTVDEPRRGLVLRGADVPDGRFWLEGQVEALPGRRNPGGFDARAYHRRHGVRAALRLDRAQPRGGAGRAAQVRAALRAGTVAGLDPPRAALMQALTLGIRDDLGPLREVFAASGTAHVLALSGLHVGVLAVALVALVGGVGRRRSLVVVAVLLAYVAVVGAAPAVVRAAAMVSFALLGRAFGLGGAGWGSHLALAAGASLLARPGWVGDLGFQLSYASVLGMGWAAAPLARWLGPRDAGSTDRLRRGRRVRSRAHAWAAGSVAVSVAAQAATLPLVASAFGAVPLAAPIVNLAAVPLATLLVPLGFGASVLGLVSEGAAAGVNHATGWVAGALIALAGAAARGPVLPWGEVAWVGHAAYALGAAAVLAGLHRAWRPWRSATVVATAMAVTAAVPPAWGTPDLIVLDVGQGDATVVRVARGQAVLVDGGGTPFGDFDVGARTVVPALRALGVAALPLVVATHPDLDHVEGLQAVVAAFPVGALLIGHPTPDVAAHRDLIALARERGVPVLEARRGDRYRVGRAVFEVLHPRMRPRGEPNDDSVALLVRWGEDPWALLLGDVSAAVEAELAVPPTPVLLAPHHGSASSTSEALLRSAQPRLALVSVGSNRYGHPSPKVLDRLMAAGATVRTTLAEGALRVPYPAP
ncbi:MAG: ComEC/Rec2 family competence protein [Trueperaceae bacterium]